MIATSVTNLLSLGHPYGVMCCMRNGSFLVHFLFVLAPGLGAIISFIYSFIYLFSFILPLHTVLVNKSFKPSLMLISGDTRASEAQGSPFHGLP